MARRVRLEIACLFALLGVATPLAAAEDGDPPTPSPPLPVVPVGEVVATTTRSERANLETPGNITVIEREDIEKSGARNVPDLLRREAGIWVTNDSTNPEGYRIEARGFENGGGNGQGTLVLIDGVRVTEAASSRPDWALLRLANIERIEVVRGPVNAAWGDNAEAGVIHITTRSGEGAPVFESRGRFGSWDTYGGSIFAGGSQGALRASLFMDRLHTDAYRDRASFRDHSGVLKLGYDLGDVARFDLKGGYSSDRRERPGNLSQVEIDLFGRRAAEPSRNDNDQHTRVRFLDGTFEVFPEEDVTFRAVTWYRDRSDDGAVGT
ncbi:MAG: TonB-dependent receptor plug domain-containing protein, partial [Myxococcota bacterium]